MERNTRSAERYVFDTEIVHMDVYAKSPYIKGVCLWNSLSNDVQALSDGHKFKTIIKKDRAIFFIYHQATFVSLLADAESSYAQKPLGML